MKQSVILGLGLKIQTLKLETSQHQAISLEPWGLTGRPGRIFLLEVPSAAFNIHERKFSTKKSKKFVITQLFREIFAIFRENCYPENKN